MIMDVHSKVRPKVLFIQINCHDLSGQELTNSVYLVVWSCFVCVFMLLICRMASYTVVYDRLVSLCTVMQ